MSKDDGIRGFILSDAAYYAWQDQDIYPDVLSFCSAIPSHLRPLFVIPVTVEMESNVGQIASRIASTRVAEDETPSGQTEEADWFGTKTFTYDDVEPTVPSSDPGSIFDIDGADSMTHHQEYLFDENIQNPTDTSYPTDIDMTQYWKYPYRTEEKPVRHSSVIPHVMIVRLALKSDELETHTPAKIREKAEICNVKFVSFDKRNRVYTFSVNSNKKAPHIVKASLSDLHHVAITCDCPFWQWNGPEYHAKKNGYLLGEPHGTASPPDIRDPERKYWLCKHAYAVTTRLDSFTKEIAAENADLDEEEVLKKVDDNWDKLEGVVQIPLEQAEDADDVDVEWEEIEDPEEIEGIEAEAEKAEKVEEEEKEEEETPEIKWEEITEEDIDWDKDSAESEDEEKHWEGHLDESKEAESQGITDEDIDWESEPEPKVKVKGKPEEITDEDIEWEEPEEEEEK